MCSELRDNHIRILQYSQTHRKTPSHHIHKTISKPQIIWIHNCNTNIERKILFWRLCCNADEWNCIHCQETRQDKHHEIYTIFDYRNLTFLHSHTENGMISVNQHDKNNIYEWNQFGITHARGFKFYRLKPLLFYYK